VEIISTRFKKIDGSCDENFVHFALEADFEVKFVM